MLHRRDLRSIFPPAAWLAALACGGSLDAGSSAEPEGASSHALESDKEHEPDSVTPRLAVEGGAQVGAAAEGVEPFLGIPYALPPVGPLRFQPPQPIAGLATEQDATGARSACLQFEGTMARGSEDCLYLNVYRPAGTNAASKLPVMVWIHGGSFLQGAGIDYDPRRLVEQNEIVVVTINYRLGALGFLALPTTAQSQGSSGNYGLMDQQEALRWVQKNIATFGGDPNAVTIQGQSAGGASVCAHLTSPLAAGLFSRAVIQSGGCVSGAFADAARDGSDLAARFPQCQGSLDMAECLRGVPAADIRAAAATDIVDARGQRRARAWGPVVSGSVLPEAPAAVVARSGQQRVPVLIGSVSDEMRGFLAGFRASANTDYAGTVSAYFGAAIGGAVVISYPPGRYSEPFLGLTAAASDSSFGCGAALLADQFSSAATTYAYEFDDPKFGFPSYLSPVPGASHSADLPFLFEAVMFDAPISNKAFDSAQDALADQMVSAWGAFIKTGNPSTSDIAWPPYTTAARTMLSLVPGAVATTADYRARHQCEGWGF
jgi:para-nitrobenzyl esterase